ncbi:hypothetical protein BKA62DRAFT_773126 [Auriculariales sp. MPI-PUGE-AT-0066]|nr:hypothetical protein BKA62DRAFT_773126 [Auriculariales sp. MPI-PUGE-AT-0066]
MPTMTQVVLDNVSPLIRYDGPWRAGKPDDDQYENYSGGTFAVTNSNAATATISFKGTGITVKGAKRPNHNKYSVSVDGIAPKVSDGHSDHEEWVDLYSTSNLRDGEHTIVIQNASDDPDPENSYLDIDQVILDTTVEQDRATIVNDFEISWQWSPAQAQWNAEVPNLETTPISNESNHATTSKGAAAILYFMGSGIDLYGIVCQQCGEYSVSIDDGQAQVLTARNADHNIDSQILYISRGLEDKLHWIRIENTGEEGNFMGINSAIVYGSAPGGVASPPRTESDHSASSPSPSQTLGATGSSTTGEPSVISTEQHSGKRIPLAEIICGILAGLLFLLALFVFFLLRQRKRRGRRPGPVDKWRESFIPSSPVSPTAMASPFRLSMHQPPSLSAPSMSHSDPSFMLGFRGPSRSGSMRSQSTNPFDVPGVPMSAYGSVSDGGISYGHASLLQALPPIARAPSPGLGLHEVPPAYDLSSRPPSLDLDRKM